MDSLTARLKAHCQAFRVDLRVNRWGIPWDEEMLHLNMGTFERAWVREVFLVCDGVPWVFARTIMPEGILTGTEGILTDLGNRPLGEYLFQDPRFKRVHLVVDPIASDHALFKCAMSVCNSDSASRLTTRELPTPPQPLWARRSLFALGAEKELLVTEVFTPLFIAMLESTVCGTVVSPM
jgi:chorismate--pyruvate lyase